MKARRALPIVECTFGLDGGAMFGVVPRPLWSRSNPADDRNRIDLAARCLVIDIDDRRVLVDTGMGDDWHGKTADIYKVDHPEGSLRAQLDARGIAPDSITDVLMTHLHFDHAGGLMRTDDGGSRTPTFPAARHWVQRENWVWAHHPTLRDAGSYRRDDFAALGDLVDLELVDGVSEILPGIQVIPTRGHTPGMQIVRFDVGDHRVVYVADLIPTLGHLQLAWVMGYDVYPLSTVREKHEVLENAVNNDWVLALEHDPVHAFARIERDGPDRYRVAEAVARLEDLS